MKALLLIPLALILLNRPVISQVNKQFKLYDAMPYIGKPDLTNQGLDPIYLMYEGSLTKPDPSEKYKIIIDSSKIETQAFVASLFPSVTVSTDIEEWYGNRNVDAKTMKIWYQTVFDFFRKNNEKVFIGNYGLPVANLNLRRFNRSATEKEIIDEWKRASAKRMYSGNINDYLSPSFYIAVPDTTQWLIDMEISANYLRTHFPDKKIYAYIWPQYYDFKTSAYFKTFMTPETWKAILNGCYKYLDGAIIWSSAYDENRNLIHWQEERVQKIWEVTKNFINEKKLISSKKTRDGFDKKSRSFSKKVPTYTLEIKDIAATNQIKEISTIVLKPKQINKKSDIKSDSLILICYKPSSYQNSDKCKRTSEFLFNDIYNNLKKRNTYKLGLYDFENKGLSEYRKSNSNFFINIGSWIQNTDSFAKEVEQKYSDFLVSRCFIVDDDITSWEKEFYVTVKELKRKSQEKPIYVLLNTHYWNNERKQKINKKTLRAALDLSQKLCDGIILIENNDILNNKEF